MIIKANAKINLALNVIERLDNGYHRLESIILPIMLYDELEIMLSATNEIICDHIDVPTDDKNIVMKVIKFMQATYGVKENFKVMIKKHIPMEAGLGGGSADGGAVIRAICELTNISVPIEEIALKSSVIGADVPFCVLNEVSLMEGIGEKLTKVKINFDYEILLVKPTSGISTKAAYEDLNLLKCDHPDCSKILELLKAEDPLALTYLANSLEESAFRLNPAIKDLVSELKQFGFSKVLMSGSGSCIFALTKDPKIMDKAYLFYCKSNKFVKKTKIFQA